MEKGRAFEQRIARLLGGGLVGARGKSSLGKAGGVSSATVGNWVRKAKLNGFPSEHAETLRKFAAQFGKTLDWLLDERPLEEADRDEGESRGTDTMAMAREAIRALVDLDDVDEATAREVMWAFSLPDPTPLRLYIAARRRLKALAGPEAPSVSGGAQQAVRRKAKNLAQSAQAVGSRNASKRRKDA